MKIDTTKLTFKEQELLKHLLKIKTPIFGYIDVKPVLFKKFEKQLLLLRTGYPLDYLLGEIQFLGYNIQLDNSVLIPREETEYFVKSLISLNKDKTKNNLLIDIGTGSGVIGIALSQLYIKTICSDISDKALKICKKNINLNKIKDTTTLKSDLLTSPKLQKEINQNPNWDLISNLPYLPIADKKEAVKNLINFEPEIALYSGKDGLGLFRKLVIQMSCLKLPENIFLELDPRNVQQANKEITNLGPYKSKIVADINGLNRFIIAKKSA
jgi:release factor glutamine methyltransferase